MPSRRNLPCRHRESCPRPLSRRGSYWCMWICHSSEGASLFSGMHRCSAFPPEGCIDLFVFDYVPENPRKEKRQVFLLRLLQGMIKTKVIYEGFSLPKKVMLFGSHAIGKLFSRKTKQRWYDSISQWGDHENASLIARYNGSYKGVGNARYPADIISEYENIQFEGLQFMALKGWDKFLSIMYGDYMKVPEKSKRITTHEHIGQKT